MKMTDKQKDFFTDVVLQPWVMFVLSFILAGFLAQGLADIAMAGTQKTTIHNFLQKAFYQAAEMPSPRVEKALHSVNRQYCLLDAKSQGRMQHRLAILGIKTPVRTGIQWPIVMFYHRVCAPTKADLHIYEQAHYPIVEAVRRHFHMPIWNLHQAYLFCSKQEGVKAVSPVMPWQMEQVFNGCFAHKK